MRSPIDEKSKNIILLLLILSACSGFVSCAAMPQQIDGEQPLGLEPVTRGSYSDRALWGVWEIRFDLQELETVIVPSHYASPHFDITAMILPPACDDCLDVTVNSFDPVTRILDADVTLRNPYQIAGRDVRGILFTNDFGHELANADNWTALFDAPGGGDINPFKAFAKASPNRIFAGGAEYTEKYLIYIPKPPNYAKITYTAEASYPGNCKEPYEITNFTQDEIGSVAGSSGSISVDVSDWQDDVDVLTLEAPLITGEGWSQFTHVGGTTWTLELTNNEGASPGVYRCRIIAASANSGSVMLYDFVDIIISGGGIASKYPGDAGIEDDPAVIFVEQFDESNLDELFDNWEEAKNKGNISFSSDSPSGCANNQSMKVHHVGEQDTGAHLYRRLLPGYDQLYVRFYVKFDPDCGKIHHFFHFGGYNPSTPWPQGGAGEQPNGDERVTTGVEPFGDSWRWDFYSYWMEMRDCPTGDHWGNDFINDSELAVELGEWTCCELMMKMNDPVTAHNGEMTFWINGQLWSTDGQIVSHLEQGSPKGAWVWDSWIPDPEGELFEGFRWRMDEDLKINFLWLLVYITDTPTGYVSECWYDQVVVATEYIGPIHPQ